MDYAPDFPFYQEDDPGFPHVLFGPPRRVTVKSDDAVGKDVSVAKEKIPMTTPVKVSGEGNYKVAFIMPSSYKIEDLPIPDDKSIVFREIGPEKMAAVRFSGFFNQKRIDKGIQLLKEYITSNKIEVEDNFIIAGYSPPWIPGFLARNEVLVKI